MTQDVQWVPGNHPIVLNPETPPATLLAGSMVVFAIDRETGERLHLFSIQPGEPIMPLASPADAAWEIAAVPLATSCLQSADGLREWEQIFAIENWLAKMGEALGRFRQPGKAEVVIAGRTLHLQPRQRVVVEQGIDFVRLESGSGLFLGKPVAEGAVVALSPGLWLEAVGESEWKALESGASSMIHSTIEMVVPLFFEVLDEVKRRRKVADRERFAAREELHERMSQAALDTLAGVVGKPKLREMPRASGDPLFDSMRAAASHLRATVRLSRDSRRRTDAIREIAQASGLRVRTVVLSGEWWRHENGPMVGYTQDGNPVALLPTRGSYEIFDPAGGTRQRLSKSVSTTLNSYAQMLYRPLPEPISTRGLIKHALRSRQRDLWTMALAGAGAALLGMAAPQGVALLIGHAIPDGDSAMIWEIGGAVIAAACAAALLLFTQAVAIMRVQSAAFANLQTGVWDYLLQLSPSFFRRYTAGQLRLRADTVTRINQLLSADAMRTVFAGVASVLTLLLVIWYSPALAGITVLCAISVGIQTWFGARTLLRLEHRWEEMEELLSGVVLQSINAVSKLRVAGAENRAFAQWAREYSKKQKLTLEIQSVKDRMHLFNMVLPPVGSALAFMWLLYRPIELGPFIASIAAMATFLVAVTSASGSFSSLVLSANLWRSLRSILAAKPEVDESSAHPGRLRGAITVSDLSFRYRADGPMVLDHVSISAEPGECIAITGPSGSGKSTLLNLLLRFETPQAGAIYLDGRELSSLDITAVRRQIGVVTQDGRIMAGTLFESICGGGMNTMEEVWDAARAAGLAEDIRAMPMGMYTQIAEGGSNLSGGQRQRLLIARALVLKPSILLFDEATSALDNRTQAIVTDSLNRLKATRVIIAHRLSTIRNASRIYVIERGRVVQHGRFEELANEPGLFARLISRQKT